MSDTLPDGTPIWHMPDIGEQHRPAFENESDFERAKRTSIEHSEMRTHAQGSEPVDISGIDKAELLFALYDNATEVGMGVSQKRTDVTVETMREYIDEYPDTMRFDYVFGRPLKVNIGGDELDPRLYDRDWGAGAAARIVAELRK